MIPLGRLSYLDRVDALAPCLVPRAKGWNRRACLGASRLAHRASRQRTRRMCLPPRTLTCALQLPLCHDPFACRPWATSSSALTLSSAWTSLHCDATSRWTHVATVCFMRFRCMLHIFYLDVAKVDLVLHMLQWLYIYISSVCSKCFSCFKCILQVCLFDVAYVALAIHICCKCMF
jgi:hypothetical protein